MPDCGLEKPLAHLHTQFNRDLPWATIDMDFMNLNQAAHGDREFGHLRADAKAAQGGGRALAGGRRSRATGRLGAGGGRVERTTPLEVARLGDNMRQVAVTEGDKVEAQIRLGWKSTATAWAICCRTSTPQRRRRGPPRGQYDQQYRMAPPLAPRRAATPGAPLCGPGRIGAAAFLDSGGFHAFTDTFEDLHVSHSCPGWPCSG